MTASGHDGAIANEVSYFRYGRDNDERDKLSYVAFWLQAEVLAGSI